MYDILWSINERSFTMYDVICWTIDDFPRLEVCSNINFLLVNNVNHFIDYKSIGFINN
jgi:hypothetical protein